MEMEERAAHSRFGVVDEIVAGGFVPILISSTPGTHGSLDGGRVHALPRYGREDPLEKYSHVCAQLRGRDVVASAGGGERPTKPFYEYLRLRLCPQVVRSLVIVDVLQLGTKNNKGTAIVCNVPLVPPPC